MNLTKYWASLLDDYVIDLAWSPDGGLLAGASTGGAISIFRPQAATGELKDAETRLHELPGHDDGVNCIGWAPGAMRVLASGGQDGAVKFWDAGSGQHTGTAELGAAWVDHIAWRPAGKGGAAVLAAAAGREVVFMGADASVRHRCATAPKTVQAIAWEPAGGAFAAAHFGGVRLWDGYDFSLQKELRYDNGIHSLVWSPDNRWLVSGNQDQSVHLWIPETGLELHMSGYESKVTTLAFDRAGTWLATGGGRDACVWNCSGPGPEGREPEQLPHPARVCALAFQHSHGLLASASEDGSVMLWDLGGNKPLRATVKMPSAATKLVWSPDDHFLAIGSEKGAVYVLSVES